jgi:hypothetical protein
MESYTVYEVIRDDEVVITTTDKQQAQNFAKSIAGVVKEVQTTDAAMFAEEVVQ